MTVRVATLLEMKTLPMVQVDSQDNVASALDKLMDHGVGAVVVARRGRLYGLFTERDYLQRIARLGRSAAHTPLHAVTNQELHFVGLQDTVDTCVVMMNELGQHHLPVANGGKLVGVVSIDDCVAALCEEQAEEVVYCYEYLGAPSHVRNTSPSSTRALDDFGAGDTQPLGELGAPCSRPSTGSAVSA